MFVGQKQYSYEEIQNKLNAVCNLNKNNNWLYPDLTSEPISRVAKVIRYALAISSFTYLVHRFYEWNGIDVEKSKLFLSEIKKSSRFNPPIATLAEQAISNFNQVFSSIK